MRKDARIALGVILALTALVVVIWVRSRGPRPQKPAETAQAEEASPVEALLRKSIGQRSWYGMYMMKEKVGYALTEVVATKVGDRDAVSFSLKAKLQITALGQKQDMRLTETRVFFRTGEFHSVSNQVKTSASDVTITGVVQGDKLLVTSQMGDQRTTKEFPAPKEGLKDALAAELLVQPDAKIGDHVTFTQFEPTMLKDLEVVLTLKERKTLMFNGVPTQVCVLSSRMPALGFDSEMCVDERGDVMEMTVGQLFVLRLEPEQQAKDIRYSSDLMRTGCVRLDPAPKQVAQTPKFRFQIWGVEDEALILNDRRQTWTAAADGSRVVECRAAGIDARKAVKLPVDRERFAKDLEPTLFAQSDDARVKKLAADIVGDERDALAATRKINTWVFKNIRKVGTAALSNAIETLASREGDCTEHTVLFVALARAAGIPAREIAGVTAVEGGEGLYYHAWPEVWVGEWVAVDPTLGQELADATHIKFAQGGTENLFRVASIFGKLKAKILDLPGK